MQFRSGKIVFLILFILISLFFMLPGMESGYHGEAHTGEDPSYHTYDEIQQELEEVASENADIVKLVNLSKDLGAPLTYGNRSLMAVQITDQDNDPKEPAILITGVHHAREWIAAEVPLFFIHHLVDNYGTDPYVTYLVDNRDIWIIPIVNPDGYVKSWEQNDRENNRSGWRKNLRDNNEDGVIDSYDGVDLNRNYGYQWGYDNSGSSNSESSSTYRGPAPFSEPETQAIRLLCNDTRFQVVIHYHSKGELNLYPWAYDDLDTEDHDTYVMIAEQMSSYNGYTHGNTKDGTIYKCNGEACDWHYSEFGSFAYTVELAQNHEGYIPDETRILPICLENLELNLFVCDIADDPSSLAGYSDPGISDSSSGSWEHSGPGDDWGFVGDGIMGAESWTMTVGDGVTNAELELNHSIQESDGPVFLKLWEKYDLSLGSEAGIFLRDETGIRSRLDQAITSEMSGRGQEGSRSSDDGTRGDGTRNSDDRTRGDGTRNSDDGTRSGEPAVHREPGSSSDWQLVYYNLTPYLLEEPQWLTFLMNATSDMEGDNWSIDLVTITTSSPAELITDEEQGTEGDYDFSISPGDYDRLLLPGTTDVLTLEITNEHQDNNTVDLSTWSENGWDIELSIGGEIVDHVDLEVDETIIVNITIRIPEPMDAGIASQFTVDLSSRDNSSQTDTLTIDVSIDAFYHISIEDSDDQFIDPGEQIWIEFTVKNHGNSQVEVEPELQLEEEGWTYSFMENPSVDPYGEASLFFSVTAPDQIEADEDIDIRVDFSVVDHGSGDGSNFTEVRVVVDEIIDAGFGDLDSLEATPGKENEFTVRLYNHGNAKTDFTISAESESEWEVSLSSSSRQVDPYKYTVLTLYVTPPTTITAGQSESVFLKVNTPIQNSTTISISSTSFYAVEINVDESEYDIPAGREKDVIVRVYNRGNTENSIVLLYSQIDGFSFSFSKNEMTVPAFSSTTTKLTISVTPSTNFGQRSTIAITATSDDDPSQEHTTILNVTIGKSYEVKLTLPSEQRKQTISPGETASYTITITNHGNAQCIISLEVLGVPPGWTAELDDDQISLDADKHRLIRLSVTAPNGAKNNEEAEIVVKAETGDDDFGIFTDDVTATTQITADESESSGISLLVIAGGFLFLLLIIGVVLYQQQKQGAGRGDYDDYDSYHSGSGSSSSEGQSTRDVEEETIRKALTPATQNVSCPKCSEKFEVELPDNGKKTVKTMCVGCGEIFAFDRKEEPVDAGKEKGSKEKEKGPAGIQNVSCPKCEAKFEVELPASGKKTVKTMCVECGEIFAFDRKESLETPSESEKETHDGKTGTGSPGTQNVACPECKAKFEVELPASGKKTIKTMCVECGGIFSFEREEKKSEIPAREQGSDRVKEKSDGEKKESDRGTKESDTPDTQNVNCPKCKAKFDVELPLKVRRTVKTMCVECGEIFSFDRKGNEEDEKEEQKSDGSSQELKGSDEAQSEDQDQRSGGKGVGSRSGGKEEEKEIPVDKSPEPKRTDGKRKESERGSSEQDDDQRKPRGTGGAATNDTDEVITSRELRTGEVREIEKSKKSDDEDKKPDDKEKKSESQMAVPKVMKCPKCNRKVFLKGSEERVKCMFCGTRIQIERRKKR